MDLNKGDIVDAGDDVLGEVTATTAETTTIRWSDSFGVQAEFTYISSHVNWDGVDGFTVIRKENEK